MAYTIVLDTSAVINLLKRKDKRIIEAIEKESVEEIVITGITRFELEVATKKDRELIAQIPCISCTCNAFSIAANMYSSLQKEGKKPQLKDCFIAACAIDVNGTLITCDKDFGLFEKHGLKQRYVT